MDVVDFIASAPTQTLGRLQDVPVEPIMIEEVRRKSLLNP